MNILHKHILILATVITGLIGFTQQHATAQGASGEELKIGYVDPQAVLQKMPEMKAVQQRLQNFAERKREELQQKEQNFQQQVESYQQRSAVISDQAKTEEEERLGQLNAELQQFRSQLQQELQQKQQELVGPLFQQIEESINNVADDMGLTYVINTTTMNGDVIVLYASPEAQEKYDITDAVMNDLGI